MPGAWYRRARRRRSGRSRTPASSPTSSPPPCRDRPSHGGHAGRRVLSFLAERRAELAGLVVQHLILVLLSTAVAVAIGVPAAILLTRSRRLARPVLAVAGVLQTIPSLALFGFLIPLPLVGGIGARTAIVALVLYALLPIVRNTFTGIRQVDPAVLEAATGLGMT